MKEAPYLPLMLAALVGLVLVGSLLSANRQQIGRWGQMMLLSLALVTGAAVGLRNWPALQNGLLARQSVVEGTGEISVPRGFDGHYYLTLDVNGAAIRFVIDTGASQMVLTPQDAARAGINPRDLRYDSRAMTANGMVQTAAVRLQRVSVGGITDRGVSAVVNGAPMQESLLGMSYLNLFSHIEIADGRMLLRR